MTGPRPRPGRGSPPLEDVAERDLAVRRARALSAASLAGGFDKGFVKRTAPRAAEAPERLTVKQADWLGRLAWKYRRQLPAAVVPTSQPS